MDKHVVALWVLDYMLRQPLDGTDLNSLIRILRRSDTNSNLKKLLLLRKIESEISKGSISENLLELLERIEELEYRDKIGVTAAMKNAYCAVAVHCAVRFLEENEKEMYFEAVKNVWRARVCKMEESENVGLVSDELISWSDEIETAVWDGSVCKNLLLKGKGIDVFEAVRVYVKEAKESMGPSFLELLAEKLLSQYTLWELLGLGSKGKILFFFVVFFVLCLWFSLQVQ